MRSQAYKGATMELADLVKHYKYISQTMKISYSWPSGLEGHFSDPVTPNTTVP